MTSWDTIERQLDAILDRRWYTNHGPMAKALEARCSERFGARHAIIATNPTIGLIMLIEALGPKGEILVSSDAPSRCIQAIRWAGLMPRMLDVRAPAGRQDAAVAQQVAAVLCTPDMDAVHWAALATSRGLAFIGDSVEAGHGPCVAPLACFGDDAALACLLTGDDHLAARLRNIRSSYGAGPPVPVARTANGRVSEAQAAMALLTLDEASAG